MFKKALYPFTDWNWLKLPFATAAVGGLALLTGLSAAASMAYHRDHIEASVTAVAVAYFALLIMYLLVVFALQGYLVRVARQPMSDEPYKLPKWSGVGELVKDGFLCSVAQFIVQMFFVVILELALLVVMVVFGGFGALLHHQEFEKTGMAVAFAGSGAALLFLMALCFGVILALGTVWPLLLARYARTGKFSHFFSLRWAWNAFTIAPWEYLGRTSIWTGFLAIVTILTPLTAGGAYIIGMAFLPLFLINAVYLVGDYYGKYLDD